MRHEILHRPSYALGVIHLESGERIKVEPDAVVSMSSTIHLDTSTRAYRSTHVETSKRFFGVLRGPKRSVQRDESFWMNNFTAEAPGEVTIAPALPGDIEAIQLEGESIMAQSGSFLAAETGIEIKIDSKWGEGGGAQTSVSKEERFLLKCEGAGALFISSVGAIHLKELANGEQYAVDAGHMVVFDSSIQYSMEQSVGWKSTLSEEGGLVCKLVGPGRFYMQTRSDDAFASRRPQLPSRRSS